MILSTLGAVAVLSVGQVSLRGFEPAAAAVGQVVKVDAAGVWLGAEQQTSGQAQPTMVIGWDRVKSVGAGSGEPQAKEAAAFGDLADALWRARTRLERGDFIAAEPLFERYFERYRGQKGPTAAVVAEGLLRCRLRRAAHVAAVDPWLALLAAKQERTTRWAGGDWASEAGLGSVLDAETGLAPALPPIWLNWPSVAAWARTEPVSLGDPRTAALAALYQASARFEAGMDASLPASSGGDPGLQIVREIVSARIGDETQRSEARAKLVERIRTSNSASNNTPAWLEAWCRAGLGRSLVRESDSELQRLGVIELLHVPARFSRAHPYLAGIALAEAAATLRQLGDSAGAEVLGQELATLYPTHPVRDWEASGGRGPAGGPAAATVLPPVNETTSSSASETGR